MSTTEISTQVEEGHRRLLGALVRLEIVLREVARMEPDIYGTPPSNDGAGTLTGTGLTLVRTAVVPAAEALVALAGELEDGTMDAYDAWGAGMTALAVAHAVLSCDGPLHIEGGDHPQPTELAALTVAHRSVRTQLTALRERVQRLGLEEEEGAPA